jgi:hypothetical protein
LTLWRGALLVATVLLVSALARADRDPGAEFAAGIRAYEQRRYAEAVSRIAPLLYPRVLLPVEEQIVDAHKVLAISHFQLGARDPARKEFVSLLGLRPEFVLDPVAEPAPAVSFFESVKKELEERARSDRERQMEQEIRRRVEAEMRRSGAPAGEAAPVVERLIERRMGLRTFLPFGLGQFANAQRRKGWAFLLSEAGLLAASVTAWATIQINHGRWTSSSQNAFTALNVTQVTAGALFIGVALWGIVDAVVHTPLNERVIVREPKPGPPIKAFLSPGGLVLGGTF